MANVFDSLKTRQKYSHFRILVIGRANAGKTTLLQRVCNTIEDPCIYDEEKNLVEPTSARGIHNINRPFAFQSNPQFIFHDSPGFEAGDESQLKKVQEFIEKRAKSTEPNDQLHVIWFCFGPSLSRPLLELEERFFNEQRAGNVPVIAIFTKFDDLITQVFKRRSTKDQNRQAALSALEARFELPLRKFNFPPRAYLFLENMQEDNGNHQDQVKELTKKTADSLDDLALKMLFVSVQQNNLELCISYAVEYAFRPTAPMGEFVMECLLWFRHSYNNDHKYGKTEQDDLILHDDRRFFVRFVDDRRFVRDDLLGNFRNNSHQVKMLMSTAFNAPSLAVFAAVIICLENSFWYQSKSVTFSDSFQQAFRLYTHTGTREKVEMGLQSLGDYPSPNTLRAFKSSLLKIVLEHRLPRSENSNSQIIH